jgi:hypothetical protein
VCVCHVNLTRSGKTALLYCFVRYLIKERPCTCRYIGGTETRVASSLGSTQYALGFEGAARGSADVASAVVLEKVLFGNGVAIP